MIDFFETKSGTGVRVVTVHLDGELHSVRGEHRLYSWLLDELGAPAPDLELMRAVLGDRNAVGLAILLGRELRASEGAKAPLVYDPLLGSLVSPATRFIVPDAIVESAYDGALAGEPMDWIGLLAFFQRLDQNPSLSSREHLYDWVLGSGMEIRSDGQFLAFKGLAQDELSIHSGNAEVDGVLYLNMQIPNHLGAVVSMPRREVNDNPMKFYGVGLHITSEDHAANRGRGSVATVLVDPADVVVVSGDSYQARVCRYEVVALTPRQ